MWLVDWKCIRKRDLFRLFALFFSCESYGKVGNHLVLHRSFVKLLLELLITAVITGHHLHERN